MQSNRPITTHKFITWEGDLPEGFDILAVTHIPPALAIIQEFAENERSGYYLAQIQVNNSGKISYQKAAVPLP